MLVCAMLVTPVAGAVGAPPPTWVRTLDPGGMDLGEGASVGPDGSVFVTGIAEIKGQQDLVTGKLNADGTLAWARTLDRGARDRGDDVAATRDGGAVVVGSITGSAGDDAVVLRYSASGELLWSTTFDKGTAESARGVALDREGNVFMAGTSISINGADGFIAKFSSSGTEIWARAINLYYFDEGFDVDVDAAGQPVVVGRVLRETDFDVFVRKFSAEGEILWTQYVSTPAREEGRGIAAAPDGGAYVVGTSAGAAGDDLLVVRLQSGGTLGWKKTFDLAGGADAGRDVVLDPSGNLYVTGFGVNGDAKEAALLKLTPSGEEVWRAIHADGNILGTGSVAIGPGGRVVTGGAKQLDGADFAYILIAYDETPPTAAFRSSFGALPTSYNFEDGSSPGRAPIKSWRWDFGDGEFSTSQNPSHKYAWGGEVVVRLTVTDELGNAATATRTLQVDGPARPAPVSPVVTRPSTEGPPTAGGAVVDPTPQAPLSPATPKTPTTEETKTPGPDLVLIVAGILGVAVALRVSRVRGGKR